MALSPPPGMSLMEEIKWKAEQKEKMKASGGGGGAGTATSSASPVKPPVPASQTSSSPGKPPPGMSMMEEMKWKQQQKANAEKNGASSSPNQPVAATNNDSVGGAKPFKPPPPPGRKTEAPAGAGGAAKPPKPSGVPPSVSTSTKPLGGVAGAQKPSPSTPAKSTDPPSKPEGAPKVASSLASRQAMLAGIMGGGGGAAPGPKKDAPVAKKDGPAPAKKWGPVSTDGSGSSSSPAASSPAAKLGMPTDMSKYEKMMKMLPQGAVENAMVRDGFDPGYLFGENCQTMKSDKRPVAGGGGSAAKPAAAGTAPPAAPIAQSTAQTVSSALPPQQAFMPQHMNQSPGGYGVQGFAPPPGPAPSTWTQHFSPEYQTFYYYNSATGETSWTPPAGFGGTPGAPTYVPPQMIPQQPLGVVTLLHTFTPSGYNPDEMMVYENDKVEVYELGADGWIQGRCIRTGVIGLIPISEFCLNAILAEPDMP